MTNSTGPIGAAPPPPGVTPDFDNPRDVGHTSHIVFTSFIQAIVVLFFALRIYVKWSVKGKFRLEDWSCLIGWIFTVIMNSTVLMKIRYGLGYHIWELTKTEFEHLQKWMYIGSLLYSPAAFFTKISILLLTVRVFSVDAAAARILHLLPFFFLICYIPAEIAKACVCIPVQSFWDQSMTDFKCIDQTKLFLYDSSLSAFSDLIILIVPMVLASRLRVSTLKKIKIVGLLGTGGVAVAVTIYRLYLVNKYDNTKDPTMDFVPLDWTVAGELGIGIVCACFPSVNHVLEERAARTALESKEPQGLSRWWRETSKRCSDALSSWGQAHGYRMPAFRRTEEEQKCDSVGGVSALPESENGEPKKLDYDVELAAVSASHLDPHPGELVDSGVGGYGQNCLTPLPIIRRSSPFKINCRP
ncbi:integral membrane protein [Colletotrichum graminicola]|nr:integral membrane protein [Colletotrichum graminicola]